MTTVYSSEPLFLSVVEPGNTLSSLRVNNHVGQDNFSLMIKNDFRRLEV